MADGNDGKKNGEGKKYPPGKHPNQIANQYKPGQSGNPEWAKLSMPEKRRRSRDPLKTLVSMLDEEKTIELDNGKKVTLTKLQQAYLFLINKFSRGPSHPTNDPNWRWAGDTIMSRICPIPKTHEMGGSVDRAIIAEVGHQKVTLAFVERVREFAGSSTPSTDDVLRFLDQEMDGAE